MNEYETEAMQTQTHDGVTVGVVTNNEDPDGNGRVRVALPARGETAVSYWAPVAVPMATTEAGTYFLPDVDDEVLVAFENGRVDYPYVVGSLWNAEQKPPATNDDGENSVRVIRSRSGHEVRFDDGDEPFVELSSAAGSRVTLSDASGSEALTITDADGRNRIEIDVAGGQVTVTGATKVALTATELELKADGNISVEAGALLNLKGATVNIN